MKTSRGLRITRAVAASAAVVTLAALTACSDSDSDSGNSSGSGSGGDSAGSSIEAPEGSFPGNAASGDPVKIGLINNEGGQAISQPENREAAEAATKYANEHLGGIGGRPIELVKCNELEEPASARDCANQMVEAKVSTVVVTSTGMGSIMAPIITSAGIPYVSALGGSQAEITGENAFMWTAGSNTSQAMAAYAGDKGMKKVVAFSIDSPAATGSLTQLGVPAFKANGSDLKVIPIPFGSPDATPQVSAGLADNPDGVIIYGESTVCTSVLKSLSTLGSTAEIMTPQACAAPEVVDAVGAALDGAKIFTAADATSDEPESVLYRAVMEKYSPETPTTGYASVGYQGILGLVRATQSAQGADTSAAALKSAITSAKDVVLPAGDGLTFTCNGEALTGFGAVCGNGLIILTMEDGKQTDPQLVTIK